MTMKLIVLATLFAVALGAGRPSLYSGPVWPRLPMNVLLRGGLPSAKSDDDVDGKIVGGEIVTPNELPFQIVLQRRGALGQFSLSCGGSIYSESWILNAAHCVFGDSPNTFRVVAGEHSLSQTSGLEKYHDVSQIIVHEDYNRVTSRNDIAVLKLSTPLTFNTQIQAIAIPPQDEDTAAGTDVTVSGWGTTSQGGVTSDQLRKVTVPIVSDASCKSSYGQLSILPGMICAGLPQGGKDSCQGDSGGPLFSGNSVSTFKQIGVVSWGQGCAQAGYPGVYTQVSYFTDWLLRNAGQPSRPL